MAGNHSPALSRGIVHGYRSSLALLVEATNSLIPPGCLQCGIALRAASPFCNECQEDLPRNLACCARCASPISTGELCGACLRSPPPFDSAFSPLRYVAPVDHVVARLKYFEQPAIARILGKYLGEELLSYRNTPLPQALIPVPLHPGRLRQRGYNQALEITRSLSVIVGVPVDNRLVVRNTASRSQVGKNRLDRDRSVRNSFDLKRTPEYRHYAIVDDVMTSGATMKAISAILKSSGVTHVEAWSLARA